MGAASISALAVVRHPRTRRSELFWSRRTPRQAPPSRDAGQQEERTGRRAESAVGLAMPFRQAIGSGATFVRDSKVLPGATEIPHDRSVGL